MSSLQQQLQQQRSNLQHQHQTLPPPPPPPPPMYDTSVSTAGVTTAADSSMSSPRSGGSNSSPYNYFPHHDATPSPPKASSSRGGGGASKYTMTPGYRKSPPTDTRKGTTMSDGGAGARTPSSKNNSDHHRRLLAAATGASAAAPPVPSGQHSQPSDGSDLHNNNNSNHTEQSHSSSARAHSEPIFTEQDRFSAYVNRFANLEGPPRKKSTPPEPSNDKDAGGYHLSSPPKPVKSARRFPLDPTTVDTTTTSSTSRSLPPHPPPSTTTTSTSSATAPQSAATTTRGNYSSYRRQESGGSSAGATAASTASSVVNRQHDSSHFAPPAYTRPYPLTKHHSTPTTTRSFSEELTTDSSEDLGDRTTASTATRPTGARGRADQPGTIELASRGRSPAAQQRNGRGRSPVAQQRNGNGNRARSLSNAPPPRARSLSSARPSAAAVDKAMSPGTHRTRDLAKRFEQRMQAKGRNSSQLLQSAMHSAYQQQQQQQPVARPPLPSPRVVALHDDTADDDEKKEADAAEAPTPQQPRGAEIETPLPSSVKDLREKLWDEREALQVRVRPTSLHHQHHGDQPSAASSSVLSSSQPLSPNRQPPATQRQPRQQHTPPRASRSEVTAAVHHPPSLPPPPPRQSRSLSPNSSRIVYGDESNNSSSSRGLQQRHSTANRQYSELQEQELFERQKKRHHNRQESGDSESSGSAAAPRFKSKFYQAAALSSPEWGHKHLKGYGEDDDDDETPLGAARIQPPPPLQPEWGTAAHASSGSDSSLDKPLGAAPLVGPHGDNTKATGSLSRSSPLTSEAAALSQASTARATNEQQVSQLLRKLHSINRQDPTKALAEIDEILKQEALRDDPRMQQALRVPEDADRVTDYMQMPSLEVPVTPPHHKHRHHHPGSNHDEESFDEDEQSTVSSITNPTFQGAGSSQSYFQGGGSAQSRMSDTDGTDESDAPMDEKMAVTTPREKNRLAQHQYRTRLDIPGPESSGFQPMGQIVDDSERLPQTPRTTNVDQSADGERFDDNKHYASMPEENEPMAAESSEPTSGKPPGKKRLDDLYKLSRKIQRWDELSGSRSKHAGEDLVSNAAGEDLGSVLTPVEAAKALSPRRQHPWEMPRAAMLRDTSVTDAQGAEAVEAPPPKYQKPVHRPSEYNKIRHPELHHSQRGGNNTNSENPFSDDFGDAWVALPANDFFGDSHSSPPASRERQGETAGPTTRRPSIGETSPQMSPTEVRRSRTLDFEPQSSGGAYGGMDEDEKSEDELEYVQVTNGTAHSSPEEGTKKKKGLRALLQRGNHKSGIPRGPASAASITTSATRRLRAEELRKEEEAPPPRGRKYGHSDLGRSHSLEERRVRNPNIAKKFSRMLKVYGDDG